VTINLAGAAIKDVRVAGAQAQKVMLGTGTGAVEVWSTMPIVTLTGTSTYDSMNQFRQACIDHGTTYSEVKILPFQLDISQTGIITGLFYDCSSLMQLPDMTTSHVTNMNNMFRNCASLTDGNVRLIGRHPSVSTSYMITGSGLTRMPFYDTNGNPI